MLNNQPRTSQWAHTFRTSKGNNPWRNDENKAPTVKPACYQALYRVLCNVVTLIWVPVNFSSFLSVPHCSIVDFPRRSMEGNCRVACICSCLCSTGYYRKQCRTQRGVRKSNRKLKCHHFKGMKRGLRVEFSRWRTNVHISYFSRFCRERLRTYVVYNDDLVVTSVPGVQSIGI